MRTEDRTAAGVSAERPVTASVGGGFIVLCAVTAGSAVAVSDRVVTKGSSGIGWDYPPVMWPLVLALAVAGVIVMTQHRWARAAALLAAIVAAQMAGIGLIAVRGWFTVKDFEGMGSLTATPITYAVTVALIASAAAVAAAAMVWREPADDWRSFVPARPMYVVAGAAVVVGLPQIWNAAGESGDITGLQQVATLTYALPWGIGLAVVGWVRGRSAVAAGVSVTVSAVLCAVFMVATHLVAQFSTPPAGD